MDILTLVGLVAGIGIVIGAMLIDASISTFLNLPGLAIVVGGTLSVLLLRYRLRNIMVAMRLAFSTVFRDRVDAPGDIVMEVSRLAQKMRREGVLGLEDYKSNNPFMTKAISLCVDGYEPERLDMALAQEIRQTSERFELGEGVFRAMAESAPAIGMIGTLVGLVQMLTKLDDPGSIGPAMAIALLTTLYGAFIAQMIAVPLADKLALKAQEELRNQMLVATSIQSMLRGENPRTMVEVLSAFVDPSHRNQLVVSRES